MSHLRAPAKINLGLKIIGVRKDGYHLLESLFAPITLFDEISIKPDSGSHETGNGQTRDRVSYIIGGQATAIENCTIAKSLKLFREWAPETPFQEVVVQKAIPMGAGLGGGSSDAGTILRHLYKTYCPTRMTAELVPLALKVGADVPFFLNSRPAWVTGIGERIEPVAVGPIHVLICKPPFGVSTPEAFAWYDLDSYDSDRVDPPGNDAPQTNRQLTPKNTDATSMTGTEVLERQAPQRESTMTVRQVIEILENDLEKPVETRHPEIQKMRLALRQWGALGSLMTGTGSSVYGLFRNNADAIAAREKLKPRFPSTYSFFICETIGSEN